MRRFLVSILLVGGVVAASYFFAPNRVRGQMTAAIGFLGSSFGRVFTVGGETVGDAKKFVIEQASEKKQKAEEIINPLSPSERREALLADLESTISKLEEPDNLDKQEEKEIAKEVKEIVAEVKENNEDNKGFLGSIVGVFTGPDKEMCRIEE